MSDYHQQHAEAALCADVSPTAKRERSNANLEGVLGNALSKCQPWNTAGTHRQGDMMSATIPVNS